MGCYPLAMKLVWQRARRTFCPLLTFLSLRRLRVPARTSLLCGNLHIPTSWAYSDHFDFLALLQCSWLASRVFWENFIEKCKRHPYKKIHVSKINFIIIFICFSYHLKKWSEYAWFALWKTYLTTDNSVKVTYTFFFIIIGLKSEFGGWYFLFCIFIHISRCFA